MLVSQSIFILPSFRFEWKKIAIFQFCRKKKFFRRAQIKIQKISFKVSRTSAKVSCLKIQLIAKA
jgi:hypothetical protein